MRLDRDACANALDALFNESPIVVALLFLGVALVSREHRLIALFLQSLCKRARRIHHEVVWIVAEEAQKSSKAVQVDVVGVPELVLGRVNTGKLEGVGDEGDVPNAESPALP